MNLAVVSPKTTGGSQPCQNLEYKIFISVNYCSFDNEKNVILSHMNKKSFLKALTEVYTRLGVTAHGVGVIAIRPIPKGTDPFKNADPEGDVLKIPKADLDAYDAPEKAKELVRDFCALQDGVYFVPSYGIDALTKNYYLNHSDEPNMETLDKGETFIAMREICVGEELTASYNSYHETDHFERE